MCQSKSEGGRRCAFHIGKDVGAAMVTYAARMTGQTNAAVKGAYDDLVVEGAHLPAPAQQEVDAFLEQQAFRVRTEPTLTESKRAAILRRLHAAIGKVTPSGATFHAWRNIVAESWARSRRRVAAAFLVSVAFTAGGCAAGGHADPVSTPSSSTSVTAPATPGPSASATTSAPAAVVKPKIADPEVDAATLKKFGKADVAAGWKAATDLGAEYAYNPAIMNKTPEQVTAADFEGIRSQMTPDARKDWDGIVAKLPETKAGGNVNGIALQGLNDGGYTMNMENPVTDYVIDGSVTTSKAGSMMTTQRQRAVLHMRDSKNEKVKVTLSKTITFYMKKSGGKWLIDGWRSEGTTSTASADA